MAYITIEHLKYRYPHTSFLALDDISMEISKGSFIGVVGPNGAGKSTFAQALVGLVPQFYKGAYGGKVVVDGLEAGHTPVERMCRKVGIVFQNPFTQLSGAKDNVYEEVCFGMQNLGLESGEMRRRADDVLQLLGIYEYRDRNPFDLSGGQMQRVAIASILVMEPDVLVLDEPTSQLDPKGCTEVFSAIEKLSSSGITVVMVEQKMDYLARYSDKLALMDKGRLVCFDTPQNVLSSPLLEKAGVEPPVFSTIPMALGLCTEHGMPVRMEDAVSMMDGRVAFSQKEAVDVRPGASLLEIRGLSFGYTPDKDVVRDVDLSFDCRATAIIGQNGAGKTTLAKLIKGLLRPKKGSILLSGEDTGTKTVAQLASRIGYVFQNPDDQIFKHTVREEMLFGPLNIGMDRKKAQRRVEEELDAIGLLDKMDENPYDLDLHERKMVALASVLAMDPNVVIFDEPTIAQDDRGKKLIAGIIGRLEAEGRLVISILHDMDLVARCFSRVIVMADGVVAADGFPGEIFANDRVLGLAGLRMPQTAELSRLLGAGDLMLDGAEFLEHCHVVG